jgi:hypothetical protein
MRDRTSGRSRFRRMRKHNPKKRAQGLRNRKAIPRACAWRASSMTLRPEISRLSKSLRCQLHPISTDGNVLRLVSRPAWRPVIELSSNELVVRLSIAICKSPLVVRRETSRGRTFSFLLIILSGVLNDQSLGLGV